MNGVNKSRSAEIGLREQGAKECSGCGRGLKAGELAGASDWNVIERDGTRLETRYLCDGCGATS